LLRSSFFQKVKGVFFVELQPGRDTCIVFQTFPSLAFGFISAFSAYDKMKSPPSFAYPFPRIFLSFRPLGHLCKPFSFGRKIERIPQALSFRLPFSDLSFRPFRRIVLRFSEGLVISSLVALFFLDFPFPSLHIFLPHRRSKE